MKIKNLIIFVFVLISSQTFSQELSLEIYSQNSDENRLLSTVNFNNNFSDFEELKNELNFVLEKLKKIGFIKAKINQIKQIKKTKYKAEFSLKNQIKNIYIFGIDSIALKDYKNYTKIDNKKALILPIEKVEDFFKKLNQFLSNKGFPFNSAKLTNIEHLENDNLMAEIEINFEKERKIDKIVVKGYENFPKSYLKYLTKYKIGEKFNLDEIQQNSELLNQLRFVKQIKKPEILFTEDSTSIYLYLEKQKRNNFDGFIGFSNDESDNNIQFQGYLDFELVNNFNFGEEIEFLYKSEKNADRILKTNVDLPYIFKSPVGANLGLILTKKDSSFVTNEQFVSFFYKNSKSHKFSLGIRSIQSDEQLEIPNADFQDYETFFSDFIYEFSKYNQSNLLFPIKENYFFKISKGKRTSNDQQNNQIFINMDLTKIFDFGLKNSIYLNFKSEILDSDTYFSNELSRFGGAKSIRGFDENSFFSNKYFLLITEYRFKLNNTIYINSIFDLGNYENKLINAYNNIYGVGMGVGLLTKGGIFSLSYALGSDIKQKLDTKNAKIHIKYSSFF